jgi:large subunit ribosomal protein L15
MTMSNGKVKVTLNRSVHGQLQNIRASVYGLGLRRIRDVKFVEDTPGRARHDQRRQAPARRRKGLRSEDMRLNTIKPGPGSKRKRLRVGRGASAGQGKTCGKGGKGQKARKGGYHKVGFEGGQVPLQRRLPKVGFRSAMKKTRAEVTLTDLEKVKAELIDLASLLAASIVPAQTSRAKVILSGEIKRKVTLQGPAVVATKGARAAIEKAGGRIDEGKAA